MEKLPTAIPKFAVLLDFENTLFQRNYEDLAKTVFSAMMKIHNENSELFENLKFEEKFAEPVKFGSEFSKIFTDYFTEMRKNKDIDCDPILRNCIEDILLKMNAQSEKGINITLICDKICKECDSSSFILEGCVKEALQEIKAMHCEIFVYGNSVYEIIQKVISESEIKPFVTSIFSDHNKGKKLVLENAVQAFYKKGYKNYQICIIGDMLDSDVKIAYDLGVRNLWFMGNPFSPIRNNMNIESVRSCDAAFNEFCQLPALINILLEDYEFIISHKVTPNYKEMPDLPIKQRMRVGYYFPPKKMRDMALKKFTNSNSKILFYPLQVDADLEKQGKMCVLIHKCSDLLNEEFVKKKGKRFTRLMEFTEKYAKSMATIDPLRQMKLTLFRVDTTNALDKAINSKQMQEVMKNFSLTIKQPYAKVLFNIDPEKSVAQIKESIASKKCDYSFMLKPSESCQTVDSHTLTICVNEEGLRKAFSLPVYKGKEMVVQQLVKHSSTIYKFYTLGEDYLTYHFKRSLPSILPIKDLGTFDSQKPFPAEWFSGKEEVVDKLNKDFAYEVTKTVLKELDLSILGLDYIIEEGSGDYYLIDMNYFSSFRHEHDLNEKTTNHILKTYAAKIH